MKSNFDEIVKKYDGMFCDITLDIKFNITTGLTEEIEYGNPEILNKENKCQYFKKKLFKTFKDKRLCDDCIYWKPKSYRT